MLAIVGGTGLYELPGLHIEERIRLTTSFGEPSGDLLKGTYGHNKVLFLARHGSGHRLLPHEVNYRANVFALKQAGATMLLGFSAVGSLALEVKPGDLAMPEQYVDCTRGQRQRTFFGAGVAGHAVHRGLTYACVEGPRLGTQAESHLLRQLDCHLVGMTNVPEVFLAREAQMAYATVGLVTDYDCWFDDPEQHVSVSGIFELHGKTLGKAAQVLDVLRE